MKINYLALPNGNKLISYDVHDYKSVEIEGILYMIDGGQEHYIRTSHSNLVKKASIHKLISVIREEYTWVSIFNKDLSRREKPIKRLLKDLEDEHLYSIISYLKNRLKVIKEKENMSDSIFQLKFIIQIMKAEIKYREKESNKTR